MNLALPAILGFLAASVAVPLVMRFFSRVYPVDRGTLEHPPRLDLAEFRKTLREEKAVTFVGAVVFSLIWWQCLWTAVRVLRKLPDDSFVLVPRPYAWLIPGMGLGMITTGLVIGPVLRWRLGDRFADFVRHRDRLRGFDERKVARIVYSTVALLVAAVAILLADNYAYFSSSDIVINPFWSIRERRYQYSDVAWIGTAPEFVAPNRRPVRRREYVIRFKDGSSWSTLDDPSGLSMSRKNALAHFVSSLSGQGITELPILERKDL
jgi:hypothetical protein